MTDHLLDGVLVRGAVYLALALSSGPLAWAWLVERRAPEPASRWRVIAAVALLAFAAIVGVVQATLAFAEAWSLADARDVLADTAYGRALSIHVAVSAGHGVALALRRPALTLASAAATALTMARLGHASVQGAADVAVHLVHVLAAVAWLGGLVVLIERIPRRSLTVAAVSRFARVALALVGVLAASGLARTASFVVGGAREGTRELAWLGALATKLGFFAAALAVAYGHRRTGLRGLRDRDTAAARRRFQTLLVLELWLAACALLLGALLSQLPPP